MVLTCSVDDKICAALVPRILHQFSGRGPTKPTNSDKLTPFGGTCSQQIPGDKPRINN